MSKLTMRQFVKNVAKRNGIKLRAYTYIDARNIPVRTHDADDIAISLRGISPMTPSIATQAILSNPRVQLNNQ